MSWRWGYWAERSASNDLLGIVFSFALSSCGFSFLACLFKAEVEFAWREVGQISGVHTY